MRDNYWKPYQGTGTDYGTELSRLGSRARSRRSRIHNWCKVTKMSICMNAILPLPSRIAIPQAEALNPLENAVHYKCLSILLCSAEIRRNACVYSSTKVRDVLETSTNPSTSSEDTLQA